MRCLLPRTVAGCIAIALIAVGCSDSSAAKGADTTGAPSTAAPPATRPSGPVADVSTEIKGSNAPFVAAFKGAGFANAGFVEHEYLAKGTATAYAADGPLSEDGRWKLKTGTNAPYATRIVVRRPAKAADFSGTALVEWLNVSGGLDAGPDYSSNEEEILRAGHIWVGVSTQYLGVEGGPVLVAAPGAEGIAGQGLKKTDPERYKDLQHPGDGYSYDMFTQIARAVLAGGEPLGGVKPITLIAMGESQSAIALTTYYNGVQPLTKMFDGFFVHSRASVALPLVGTEKYADLAGAIGGTTVTFRDDLTAPVMDVQAEGDLTGVLNSAVARQDDSDTFRLWEVAGTAHADRHLLGPIADAANCGKPVNNGPLHFVTKAALRALVVWVTKGTLPPEAPRIELTAAAMPAVVRDGDGIAKGGIRTPLVDVPVEVLSGEPGPSKDIFCLLLGSTTPLSAEQLATRYRSATDYQMQYDKSADAAVTAGFVRGEDRDDLIGDAQPDLVGT